VNSLEYWDIEAADPTGIFFSMIRVVGWTALGLLALGVEWWKVATENGGVSSLEAVDDPTSAMG
jgi:hypothetical protein